MKPSRAQAWMLDYIRRNGPVEPSEIYMDYGRQYGALNGGLTWRMADRTFTALLNRGAIEYTSDDCCVVLR